MKPENELAKVAPIQPTSTPNDLKDALKLVADLTGEAKKTAEENPLTSSGKPKSSLKGATKITNGLKEEGIEAHKRGLVPKPNMEGGLKNNDMHIAAKSALEGFRLSEQQQKSLPDRDGE
ncbi:MAG: hypothetical protein KH230_23670 [Enterocloster asparagiformis]|nr:hypothetical protein [Enterocloster asparagiformis]